MTIVSNSASPTMCNNDAETNTNDEQETCASCRKLNDEIKTTVSQMAGKLDSLVLRVEEIYRQQQVLKNQVALNTLTSTTSSTNTPKLAIKTNGQLANGRRVSSASTASEDQQPSNNLVDVLSSLLGDATQHQDGTVSINGMCLEPGTAVSYNNSDFKIESPQNNLILNGL